MCPMHLRLLLQANSSFPLFSRHYKICDFRPRSLDAWWPAGHSFAFFSTDVSPLLRLLTRLPLPHKSSTHHIYRLQKRYALAMGRTAKRDPSLTVEMRGLRCYSQGKMLFES